jgi:endonuclease/exonuclease/phosphatase family metal-dependent hydrolase
MATFTLSVASQNVGLAPTQRVTAQAARALAAEEADLLCMQEGRPLSNGDFEDNASMTQLNDDFTLLDDGPYLTRASKHGGILVMSLELPLYEDADMATPELVSKYGARTFQLITAFKGGFDFAVLNGHCRCGSAMATAPKFRKLALRNLKTHAETLLQDGRVQAAIIAGDFNLTEEEASAEFAGSLWALEHIQGGKRSNGKLFSDVLAFLSSPSAGIRCCRVQTALRFGEGQLSDVHGGGKLTLTAALPQTR